MRACLSGGAHVCMRGNNMWSVLTDEMRMRDRLKEEQRDGKKKGRIK